LCKLYGRKGLIDEALVSYFKGPNSFTGEDVVELSCHGNPVIIEMLIDQCVFLGCRPARPGEFSRRAFENGKLSLLQAEALHGLISSRSSMGVELAHQNFQGAMQKGVDELNEKLLDICAELEARLDYPQEGLGYETDVALIQRLNKVSKSAFESAETWQAGKIRIHGAKLALIGPVNAGKSSLFNELAGRKRALVSPIPGTTRDVVEHTILMDGIELTLMDMAGIRSETSDSIESEGIALGIEMLREADFCLIVLPLNEYSETELESLIAMVGNVPRIVVGSHCDLIDSDSQPTSVDVLLSNLTGEGLDSLRERIRNYLHQNPQGNSEWIVLSQRQHDLLNSIARHASEAAFALEGDIGPAGAAEDIMCAMERLYELSGSNPREVVLDRMFSRFCIGK